MKATSSMIDETPARGSGTVRIGCVSYLNTLPLIEGLEKTSGVELIPRPPSSLAGMLASGEIDVGLVSLIDAARSGDAFELLPVGMIASRGATLTVRVYSSVPIESVTRVHADTDSHTSVALLRVLMNEKFGIDPEIVPFDAREHRAVREQTPSLRTEASIWPETLLLIGDKVVSDEPPRSFYPHTLDLGETWRGLTGLPFVYAVWMCSRDRTDDPSVRLAAQLLDRQRRHNATRAAWIASSRAGEHGWPRDMALDYISNKLTYTVDDAAREAVGAFLARAHACGALDAPASVRWADGAG